MFGVVDPWERSDIETAKPVHVAPSVTQVRGILPHACGVVAERIVGLIDTGRDATFPGECDVIVVDLDHDISECFPVAGRHGSPCAVVSVVYRGVMERGPGCSNYVLVHVVIRITVAVIDSGVVIEVVMAGEVDARAGVFEADPESVSGRRIVIEAV